MMSVSRAVTPEPVDLLYSPEPVGPAGRVGLITLATDFNSEDDLRAILPDDLRLFTTRIENANPVTVENLQAMAKDLPRAAKTLLPGYGVDVAIFGCTSGTAVTGSDKIAALINQGMPGTKVTNPLLASELALRAVGAQKIAILTPYLPDVTQSVADGFADKGFDVTRVMGFGLDNDFDMTALPPKAILEGALKVNTPDADAVFISCTAIRSAEIIAEAERLLEKPVITSNQALVWHALNLIEYKKPITGFGTLFDQAPQPTSKVEVP
ncbi:MULTISPECIES: Asp/Glu racemase [Thalassospira]|uniref:maleate cis-trans isomerase family protein n=1 Tax=Thalassospira TaxID=168934 RepID=UPI0007A4EA05|nr:MULTISPECIES: Asp/Glu racemase [Thalassospira]KZB72144.1 Asp/Glu racemase [Thalassospira sp. MCCC 1A01148]MBR9901450.1 Asp/Glu racemase [Rhodospirillales bacterium]HAI32712.1 Asp/Glu racemase [Thalassospira sp.]